MCKYIFPSVSLLVLKKHYFSTFFQFIDFTLPLIKCPRLVQTGRLPASHPLARTSLEHFGCYIVFMCWYISARIRPPSTVGLGTWKTKFQGGGQWKSDTNALQGQKSLKGQKPHDRGSGIKWWWLQKSVEPAGRESRFSPIKAPHSNMLLAQCG